MAATIPEDPCTQSGGPRKKYGPFKCTFVPKSELIKFFEEYPKLCRLAFWQHHIEWMVETNQINRGDRLHINKKHWLSWASRTLTGIAQRRFNYSKSTLASGHIYHRFGATYRELNKMQWNFDRNSRPNQIHFYENGRHVRSENIF